MAELSPSLSGADGPAPLSMVTGLPYHQSSRQRKRQRSLAPVLSAPRTVNYECSLCKESYPSEIASNPWWSLFLHECPRCHRMQIPRVDAASAAVSVDYIHAVCAEEGEGCDSDGPPPPPPRPLTDALPLSRPAGTAATRAPTATTTSPMMAGRGKG
ncbi:unnamed protein product [Ectocarpus sp. 12 AP-2014]